MIKKLAHYPTPMTGLSLAIASISVFWSHLFSNSQFLLWLGFVISLMLLLPVLLKFIFHPKMLLEDLRHPTVGSTLPTLAMTVLFLTKTIAVYHVLIATLIWLLAIALHICFFYVFVTNQIKQFSWKQMIPSWFVPPIGIVAACLTIPSSSPLLIFFAKILLLFGIMSYLLLLPIILFRLFLHEPLDVGRKPTLAIFAAPPSLCLAGYLTVTQDPAIILVMFLFSLAVVMTVTVYLLLLHLLRLNFTPAFSSFTFPLVISGTATLKVANWMTSIPMLVNYAETFKWIAYIEAIVATLMIGYVFGHYMHYLYHLFFKTNG